MADAIQKTQPQALSLADLDKMAKDVAESGLFPRWKTPQEVKVLMLLCQAEGRPAISAVQRYAPINGSPTKTADAMLGDFIAEGGDIEWTELTADRGEAIFYPPNGRKPAKVDFTFDEAREAGLASKDNWRKHRRDMLKARVITRGLRMVYPQATSFMLSSEEVRDGSCDEPMRRPEPQQVGPMFSGSAAGAGDTQTASGDDSATVVDAEVVEDGESRWPAKLVEALDREGVDHEAACSFLRKVGWLAEGAELSEISGPNAEMVMRKLDSFLAKVQAHAASAGADT